MTHPADDYTPFHDQAPKPTAPTLELQVPEPCSCTNGLVEDENWQPEDYRALAYARGQVGRSYRDGLLLCGFCDGDGWRYRTITLDAAAMAAALERGAAYDGVLVRQLLRDAEPRAIERFEVKP